MIEAQVVAECLGTESGSVGASSPIIHEVRPIVDAIDAPARVSVVVPVYRPDCEFFVQMLDSVLGQRLVNLEVVIVEDPSEDSCIDMIPTSSPYRIRYVRNRNRTGLVAQRNFGLSMCSGEFIALMDCDDIASPYRLAKQVRFLDLHPNIGVVGSSVCVIDEDSRISGHRAYPAQHRDIFSGLATSVPLCQPSAMLRRSVIDSHGGYRTGVTIAEDYDFWCRLIQAGVGFANLQEPLLYYRIHRQQLKQTNIHETIAAVQMLRTKYWPEQPILARAVHRVAEGILSGLPKRWAAWVVTRYLWGFRHGSRPGFAPKVVPQGHVHIWRNPK